MKGIILEKGRDHSVLLLSDGTFRNIKNCRSHKVGDVINADELTEEDSFSMKKAVSMVAAVFLAAFLGTGIYLWATPVQYINIDINPSVELMINRFDRIIKVKSLNDDGRRIAESISVNARHYETGISEVISAARNLGYLKEEGDILISISSSDLKLGEKTQEKIKEKVAENIEILTFDTEAHKLSAEKGLSPGKSRIIDKVLDTGTELSSEELAAIPVKDLMMRIKESWPVDETGDEKILAGSDSTYVEEHKKDISVFSERKDEKEEEKIEGSQRGNGKNAETGGIKDNHGSLVKEKGEKKKSSDNGRINDSDGSSGKKKDNRDKNLKKENSSDSGNKDKEGKIQKKHDSKKSYGWDINVWKKYWPDNKEIKDENKTADKNDSTGTPGKDRKNDGKEEINNKDKDKKETQKNKDGIEKKTPDKNNASDKKTKNKGQDAGEKMIENREKDQSGPGNNKENNKETDSKKTNKGKYIKKKDKR